MMSNLTATQGDIAFQANLYEDANPTRRGLHQARRDWVQNAVANRIRNGIKVAEVGVGCGIFTHFMSALGARVTAIDINPAFVVGVTGLPGVTPLLADATETLDLEQHDLALCSEVLEHVPADRSVALLKTLHAALAPDGYLILTTPQRFSTVELMARLLKFPVMLALARKLYGTADELGHINLLTARELEKQIILAGFTIVERQRFGFYLPGAAEFGGHFAARSFRAIEPVLARFPGLRALLWTQAYVLKKQ